MSKTKYIITLTLWVLLFIVILVFFTLALSVNKIFFAFFAVFVLLEILLTVFTYKPLQKYETDKIIKDAEAIFFSYIDCNLSHEDLIRKLEQNDYIRQNEHKFLRKFDDNCGDGMVSYRYYAFIIQQENNETVNLNMYEDEFTKSFTTTINCFIFLNENIDENLKLCLEYIKDCIIDNSIHRYKYKKYAMPFIYYKNKLFYVYHKTKKSHINEVFKILNINKK